MNKNIDAIFVWVLTVIVFAAKILNVTEYGWLMMLVPFTGYILVIMTMFAINDLAQRVKKKE